MYAPLPHFTVHFTLSLALREYMYVCMSRGYRQSVARKSSDDVVQEDVHCKEDRWTIGARVWGNVCVVDVMWIHHVE